MISKLRHRLLTEVHVGQHFFKSHAPPLTFFHLAQTLMYHISFSVILNTSSLHGRTVKYFQMNSFQLLDSETKTAPSKLSNLYTPHCNLRCLTHFINFSAAVICLSVFVSLYPVNINRNTLTFCFFKPQLHIFSAFKISHSVAHSNLSLRLFKFFSTFLV